MRRTGCPRRRPRCTAAFTAGWRWPSSSAPWPPKIVDVAVAIDVPLMRSLGALDEHAVRIDVARVMRDSAGEQFAGLARQRGRTRGPLPVGGDDAGIGALVGGDVVHGSGLAGGCACHTAPVWQGWREGGRSVFDLVLKGGRVIDPAAGRGCPPGCGVRRRQDCRSWRGPRRRQADPRRLRPDRCAGPDRSAHACLLGRHVTRRRSGRLCEVERAYHVDRRGLCRSGQPEGLPPACHRALRGAHPAVPEHLVRRHLRAVEGDQRRRMSRPGLAQSAHLPGCGEGGFRSGGGHQGACQAATHPAHLASHRWRWRSRLPNTPACR